MKRKPPTTRNGITHTIQLGAVKVYVTVNRDENGDIIELFGKTVCGVQGHVDMACRLISLAIQGRADIPTIIRHMEYDRTEPQGIAGQPLGIYDSIAKVLKKETRTEPETENDEV